MSTIKNSTILSIKDKFLVGTHNLIINEFCLKVDMRIKSYTVVIQYF